MATSKHRGSCHCGAVQYSVELDADAPSLVCNCSMCGRAGAMLQFVPPDKFTLEKGEDNLTDYRFNTHRIHHVFCKTCGIKSFARGEGPNGPMVAVNVRCLDGVDPFKVPTKQYEGRSH